MDIDFSTAPGQVRLLIADVDTDNLVLTEPQVLGYLRLHGITDPTSTGPLSQIRRAAADALDAIATSEVLVSKVIRTQDLTTDGPKVAEALRKQAGTLRRLADDADAVAVDDGGFLDVVEFSPYSRTAEATEPGWW